MRLVSEKICPEILSVTNYIAEISFSPRENKSAYNGKRAVICNVEALRNIFSIFIIINEIMDSDIRIL